MRPIKKLFLINGDDIRLFLEIVENSSNEIGGISNLILIANDYIFDDQLLGFINYHDPDIIANFSGLEEPLLRNHFQRKVINSKEKTFQNLTTPLIIFDNPLLYEKNHSEDIYYFEKSEGEQGKILFYGLNVGISTNEKLTESLQETIFSNNKFIKVNDTELPSFLSLYCNHFIKTLLLMSLGTTLSSRGGGSIYMKDNNPMRYFDKKSTIVIGKHEDLSSATYFWNMRATYPYSNIIWFPIECLKELLSNDKLNLHNIYNFWAYPDKEMINELKNTFPNYLDKINMFEYSYVYNGFLREWESFSFDQSITLTNGEFQISHPPHKSFSSKGYNINVVLDIEGMGFGLLPRSEAIGELFVDMPPDDMFPYYFSRISHYGISRYAEHFDPLSDSPIFSRLKIPVDEEIFNSHFMSYGFKLQPTQQEKILGQMISLVGGLEHSKFLRSEMALELLVALTPPRGKRIAKEVAKELGKKLALEELETIITKTLSIPTVGRHMIMDIDQIQCSLGIPSEKRQELVSLIEILYNKKILLRGKYFNCQHCGIKLWFPLSQIKEELMCYACNQNVTLPIAEKGKVLADSYRLNELFANGVDQGLVPVLITLLFLDAQEFYNKRHLCGFEIFKDGRRFSEVDIVFTLGKYVGIGEIKAKRGFETEQLDKLISIARQMRFDFILLTSLLAKDSPELKATSEKIKQEGLLFLLFGQEDLFAENVYQIEQFFRVK